MNEEVIMETVQVVYIKCNECYYIKCITAAHLQLLKLHASHSKYFIYLITSVRIFRGQTVQYPPPYGNKENISPPMSHMCFP